MTNNKPGDELHRHGQYIDLADAGFDAANEHGTVVTVNSAGEEIELGMGDTFVGVHYMGPEEGGERSTVKALGPVIAKVASGVTAGQELGSPATSGSERAGAFGTNDTQGVVALEDASEEYAWTDPSEIDAKDPYDDGPWAAVMIR